MGAAATAKSHFQQFFLFTSVFITLALVKLLTEGEKKKKSSFLRRNVAQQQFTSYVIWKLFCETS